MCKVNVWFFLTNFWLTLNKKLLRMITPSLSVSHLARVSLDLEQGTKRLASCWRLIYWIQFSLRRFSLLPAHFNLILTVVPPHGGWEQRRRTIVPKPRTESPAHLRQRLVLFECTNIMAKERVSKWESVEVILRLRSSCSCLSAVKLGKEQIVFS